MTKCHKFFNIPSIKLIAKSSNHRPRLPSRDKASSAGIAKFLYDLLAPHNSSISVEPNQDNDSSNDTIRLTSRTDATYVPDDEETITIVKAAVFITVMVVVLLVAGKVLFAMFMRMSHAISGRRDEESEL